jgi:hypothetical protein
MYLQHLVILFVLAATAVGLMMYAGLAKQALEPRRTPRRCPSCGRNAARDCRCRR